MTQEVGEKIGYLTRAAEDNTKALGMIRKEIHSARKEACTSYGKLRKLSLVISFTLVLHIAGMDGAAMMKFVVSSAIALW